MEPRRVVRRTATVPGLAAGLLGAAFLTPPSAQAAGNATCTSIDAGTLGMFVNYPAVVDRLELQMTGATAVVSVNGTPVGSCDLGSHTEVRMSSASGFGAWQVTDSGSFVNNVAQPAHFWFGDNDPVVVVHGDSGTGAHWAGSSSPFGVDLDGNGGADITTATDFATLTLVGSENADDIDLANGGTNSFQGNHATVLARGGNDQVVGGDGTDVLDGGEGDDDIAGWNGADTLVPGEGMDEVYGRVDLAGADSPDNAVDTFLVGDDLMPDTARGDGHDAIETDSGWGVQFTNAGAGNDGSPMDLDTWSGFSQVTTGPGPDVVDTTGVQMVDTGGGNDTVVVGVSVNGVFAAGGEGTDTLDLSQVDGPTFGQLAPQGSFAVPSFPQNLASTFEAITGSSDTDTWTIACDCTATPRGGADAIHFTEPGRYVADPTADGADTITADDGVAVTADYSQRTSAVSLTLDADANDGAVGEGDDLSGASTLLGGSGADTIVGDAQANVIDGGGGNDTLGGRGGNDTLRGDLGTDKLTGGSGNDRLLGGVGSDSLLGGDGDDLLRGDEATDPTGGNDTLDGGAGDDDEFGYRGNDVFNQGSTANGQDLLAGGLGTDRASYALRSAAVRLSLNGVYDDGAAGEGDRIGSDVENLTGGRGADTITGNALANLLTGGPGKDVLNGLGGNDTFQTLDGLVDSLFGGTGTDRAHRDTTDKVNSVEQRF